MATQQQAFTLREHIHHQALLFGLFGLLVGLVYSVGGLVADLSVSAGWVSAASAGTPGLSEGTLLAFGALLGMPLIGIVSGLLFGLVTAPLYLLFLRYDPRR